MGRRSWRYILIVLTWVSFGHAFGQVQLRQMVPADTLTTGDSIEDYSLYFILTNDTVTKPGEFRQKYNYLPEWIGIDTFFTKTDSVCLVLNFPSTDTVCTPIDTLNVIYGDPSDTSYYFQLQINGGAIDSMTHMELWQINEGANITLNYDGTTLTISADSCLQRLEQLTDSTFQITDCAGNPLDTILIPIPEGGGVGTDDQQITQFEISNDTIYLTLEDGGGQQFLVVTHPDTCFHQAAAISDTSFHILDCNGVPLDTVTLRFAGDTDLNFAHDDLTFDDDRVHDMDGYDLLIEDGRLVHFNGHDLFTANAGAVSLIGQTSISLSSLGSVQSFALSGDNLTSASDTLQIQSNAGIYKFGSNSLQNLPPINDTLQYAIVVDTLTGRWYLRNVAALETPPDSLEIRGDSIGIIGSNAVRIYDIVDTTGWGIDSVIPDTYIDSVRQIRDGLIDTSWLYRNHLSDSLLLVHQDSIFQDHDWYEIPTTVQPDHIDDNIWTNSKVRIGQDSLENAFTVLINGGIAPFEMVSSAPTNIMRQRHRTENTAWDHSYQAGVYSVIFQDLNNITTGYYLQFDEGYVGDATEPLIFADSINFKLEKYPSTRNDVTTVDSIVSLYYPAGDGTFKIAPIDSILARLDEDSTTHRDFDFILLPDGDTLTGVTVDSLIPYDSLNLYDLIWHGGQVRLWDTEWDQRYDTLSFGPTDSTTVLQIMGNRDAIDIHHSFYPYIWLRNNKGDSHIRLHNNDNTTDSLPSFWEIGFTNWVDTATVGSGPDTTTRWPFRISSHANNKALEIYQDSILLGDYTEADTTITSSDLLGSGIFISKNNGKMRLVTPDTLNALLNVVASSPQEIDTFALNNDSLVLDLTNTTEGLKYVDFSDYNNNNITLSNDSLFVGDSVLLLPQGADSLGQIFTNLYPVVGDGTRGGQELANFFFDDVNTLNLPGTMFTGEGVSTGAMRMEFGGNRSGSGNTYIDFHAEASQDYDARLIRYSGENGLFQLLQSGTAGMEWHTLGQGPIDFKTTSISRIYIEPSIDGGDVGINTSSPTAQLHVNGDVKLENLSGAGTISRVLYTDGSDVVGEITLNDLQSDLGVPSVVPDTRIPYSNGSDYTSSSTFYYSSNQVHVPQLRVGSANKFAFIQSGNDLYIQPVTTDGIVFVRNQAGTNRFQIESDGDVKIFGDLDLDGAFVEGSSDTGTSSEYIKSNGSGGWVWSQPNFGHLTAVPAGLSDGDDDNQDLSYTAASRLLAISGGTNATLPLFTSSAPGLVDGSGGGTTNFLRADGAWAAPGGSADDLGSTITNTNIVFGQGSAVADQDTDFQYNKTNNTLFIGASLDIDDTGGMTTPGNYVFDNAGGESLDFVSTGETNLKVNGSWVMRNTSSNTNIFNDAYIGEDDDEQLRIQTGGSSYVEMGHENLIANAYIRFNDDGNIDISAQGSGDNIDLIAADVRLSNAEFRMGTGNINVGSIVTNSAGTGVISLYDLTAPSAAVSNGIQLYANGGSAELYVRDEANNETLLSPHNFSMIPEGPSEPLAWSFLSNKDEKYISVDMLRTVRLVEQMSGEKLVYTNSGEKMLEGPSMEDLIKEVQQLKSEIEILKRK